MAMDGRIKQKVTNRPLAISRMMALQEVVSRGQDDRANRELAHASDRFVRETKTTLFVSRRAKSPWMDFLRVNHK